MKKSLLTLAIIILFTAILSAQQGRYTQVTSPERAPFENTVEASLGWRLTGLGDNGNHGLNASVAGQVARNLYLGASISTSFKKEEDYYSSYREIFSPVLYLKYNWVNKGLFTLYSRFGLGFSYTSSEYSSGCIIRKDYSYDFAYHFTPVGMEIGRKLRFYIETGIGYSGLLDMGIRYKF